MTGLDISKDHLIEIAVLITDGDLNIVAEVRLYRRIFFIKYLCKIIGARVNYSSTKGGYG